MNPGVLMQVKEAEVRTRIREFLISNFLLGENLDAVADGDSFLETGMVDSIGVLEFVGFVQENWSIDLTDDELLPENFDSVNNLTAFVMRRTGVR